MIWNLLLLLPLDLKRWLEGCSTARLLEAGGLHGLRRDRGLLSLLPLRGLLLIPLLLNGLHGLAIELSLHVLRLMRGQRLLKLKWLRLTLVHLGLLRLLERLLLVLLLRWLLILLVLLLLLLLLSNLRRRKGSRRRPVLPCSTSASGRPATSRP